MVKFTKNKAEQCAKEIIEFFLKHELWIDTSIYANGKRFSCYDGSHYHYGNTPDCVFVEKDVDVHRYLEYAGDFLSMSFEGPFYDVINYYQDADYCGSILTEFNNIVEKYGYYYELGNAWNLSLYKS